jgi:hypothetical protein
MASRNGRSGSLVSAAMRAIHREAGQAAGRDDQGDGCEAADGDHAGLLARAAAAGPVLL